MNFEYHRPEGHRHKPSARKFLDRTVDLSKQTGVAIPGIAEAIERIDHARDLIEQRTTRTETDHALQTRIAQGLIDGDLTEETAMEEIVKADSMKVGGTMYLAIGMTEKLAIAKAFADIGANVDETEVMEKMRKVTDTCVEEIKALRPTLDGIRDADAAAKAGAKQAAAWSRYVSELLPKFEAVHELATLLRQQHWLDPLPIVYQPRADQVPLVSKYGRPDDVIAARKRKDRKPLELLDPICDDWLPGGPYTEEEIAAHAEEANLADLEFEESLPEDPAARRLAEYRREVTA